MTYTRSLFESSNILFFYKNVKHLIQLSQTSGSTAWKNCCTTVINTHPQFFSWRITFSQLSYLPHPDMKPKIMKDWNCIFTVKRWFMVIFVYYWLLWRQKQIKCCNKNGCNYLNIHIRSCVTILSICVLSHKCELLVMQCFARTPDSFCSTD